MTSPTISAAIKPQGSRSRIARLRRARAATPSEDGPPTPTPLIFRRVWQEVAPGQWHWTHVDDQAAPK